MAKIKRGSLTTPTSTGNQDITGLGFRPGGVLLQERASSGSGSYQLGFGAGMAGKNGISASTVGTAASNLHTRTSRSDRAFVRSSTSGGVVQQARVTASLANGFRLNHNIASTAVSLDYLAFEDDIDFSMGSFTVANGSNNINVGFKPSTLIFVWIYNDSASASSFMRGMVDENLNQFVVQGIGDGANAWSRSHESRAFWIGSGTATSSDVSFKVTALTSTGFTYNTIVNNSTQICGWIAIGRQLKSKLGDVNIPSGGSGTFNITDAGFRPEAVITSRLQSNGGVGITWAAGGGWSDNGLSQMGTGARFDTGRNTAASAFLRVGNNSSVISQGTINQYLANGFRVQINNSTNSSNYKYLALAKREEIHDKDQTGALSVRTDTERIQEGLVRVQKTFTETVQGRLRVQRDTDQGQLGQVSVKGDTSRDQAGLVRISQTVIQEIVGRLRLQQTTDRDQEGIFRVAGEPMRIIQGLLSVRTNKDKPQEGIILVAGTNIRDILGRLRISSTEEHGQTGRARIQKRFDNPQTGRMRVFRMLDRVLQGRLRIAQTVDRDQQGRLRIIYRQDKPQWGILRVLNRAIFKGKHKQTYSSVGEFRDLVNYIFESEDEIFLFEDEQGYGVLVPEQQRKTLSHTKTYKFSGSLGVIINALFESEDSMFYFESEDEKVLLGPEQGKIPQAFKKNYKQQGRF